MGRHPKISIPSLATTSTSAVHIHGTIVTDHLVRDSKAHEERSTGVYHGGTGLVGSALATRFVRPTILSRSQRANAPDDTGPRFVRWQPDEGPPPAEALTDHDVVFHLAGEPVAKGRWTEAKKQRIRDSRVMATRRLVEGIAAAERKPQVLVAASAVGYYGSSGDTLLSENAPPGSGFLAEVCIDWEAEAMKAAQYGVRVVCVRIGIVLSRQGGAIEQMLLPFKMGLGGRLGDGQQWMSWIHINDGVVGLLCHAAESDISGPMNGVAPQAVRNAEFLTLSGKPWVARRSCRSPSLH